MIDVRQHFRVMAGLDPAIHVFLSQARKTWTPGTGPGVTGVGGP
jgi:hypothetical protein